MVTRVVRISIWVFAAIVIAGLLTPACLADDSSQLGVVDSVGDVTDVIVGHGTRGPYVLSWNNFDTDGISVVINGRSLRKGDDYNIDSSGGVISFNSVLATDAIVRVSYHVVSGKSKKTAGGLNVPVTLNLRSSASGSLKVTGLYTQDNSNDPNAAKSIVGLGGDRSWGSGKLSSTFLVSQGSDGDSSTGGTWDRAAMKLGGDTSLGMFKFTGGYQHSGEQFNGTKEYQMTAGKDIIDFGTAFAPAKTVQASASFNSTEDTTGTTKGNKTVTNQQNLVYTPLASTKLSLAHTTSDLTSANGSHDMTTTSGVQLTSTAIKRVTLKSSMTQKDSDSAGLEQAFNTGVNVKPIDQVSVDLGYNTLENKTVGEQATTDLKVTANPTKQVAVQAGYTGVDSATQGESTKTSVAIKAAPAKNLQISGSAANSDDQTNQQFQRDLSLSSTPTQFSKLTAMFSQKGVNDLDDVTKGAQLQLTAGNQTHFLAGYQYKETGESALTIYDYKADTKAWNLLTLAGTYRQRDVTTNDTVNSASASLSLAPAKSFKLTGQYLANPEDDKGVIQNYNSTSVGLSTQIGSVGLQTSYLQKIQYMDSTTSDETGVDLAFPLFGHGQLTTGCKVGRTLGDSQLGTRTYSLGYRHSIGSDFSLSLTGNYTQYLQDKSVQPDKSEVTTEVSLGVKF